MRDRDAVWRLVHAERAALVADLRPVPAEAWRSPSLCAGWDVEHVVAHLTAAAETGPIRWLRSAAGARFDFGLHNERRLAERLGPTPANTLARFAASVDRTSSPPGPTLGALAEVVVHAADVRRPLGLAGDPANEAVVATADFLAHRDFAVPSRRRAAGLRLEATDGPFTAGTGPLVQGPTLALVMVLAGRTRFADDLSGAGAEVLLDRIRTESARPR